MTNKNDSAYPEIITDKEPSGFENTYSYGGLTKREYFAAMAMQGILSNLKESELYGLLHTTYNSGGAFSSKVIFRLSVQASEELITELNKEQ